MKTWQKALIIAGIVLFVAGVATGMYFLITGKNDTRVLDLRAEVESLNQRIVGYETEISELKSAVNDTTVKEVVPGSSLQYVEASKVPQFVTIDSQIIFPNKLELPSISTDVNNSMVRVGSLFNFSPSENWQFKLKGTTLECVHPANIWGTLTSYSQRERLELAAFKDFLQGFYTGWPATTITYRNIYVGDSLCGMLSKADIEVTDNGTTKTMTINVGFIQLGDYALQFIFANDKTDTAVQQELIDLFLTSGTIGNNTFKLE